MRTGSTLRYLLSDHLSSTTITADGSGNKIAELRYKAWGEVRYTSGTTPSKYTFQGQFSNVADFGLQYFNARFYDPALGRFSSADTIIPPGVQGLDRYAFVYNNPIRYTDPSGHVTCTDDGYCGGQDNTAYWNAVVTDIQTHYGVTFSGKWDLTHKKAAVTAAILVGGAFARAMGGGLSGSAAFKKAYGYVNFTWGSQGATGDCAATTGGGCTSNAHQINFWSMSGDNSTPLSMSRMTKNVVHELGHAYDNALDWGPRNDKRINPFVEGRDAILRENPLCARCYDWQQHPGAMDADAYTGSETFGDMFIAATYNAWNTSPDPEVVRSVSAARAFMYIWMAQSSYALTDSQ